MTYTGIMNGLLIVGGSVIASLILVAYVRKLFSEETLRNSSDLIGNVLSIVGTFYAILLGLIVVDSLTQFEGSIDTVQAESNCVADIFMLSERLPDPYGSHVRDLCRLYVHQVADDEWLTMKKGKVSIEARKTALALFRSLHNFEPTTEAEKAVYPMILDLVRQVWDNRRARTNTLEFGIPVIEWVALVLGCVVTIVFIGLFDVDNKRFQMFCVGMTTLVIALNLYMVYLFGAPYGGELSVSNRPFILDLEIFDGVYNADPLATPQKPAAPVK